MVDVPTRRMTCNKCGSNDVRKDAWAAWNEETQEWELANVFDAEFCNSCEEECTIVEQEIAP